MGDNDGVNGSPLPDFANHSPLSWYTAACDSLGFVADPGQRVVVEHLDRLCADCAKLSTWPRRWLRRLWRHRAPRGLYVYGGVGRGKSLLMDAFFQCLPCPYKRRVHFHAFMLEVHHRVLGYKNQADPLAKVAADIARAAWVLCFDEFHVSDIADAMVLHRLLDGLFQHGVVLVATSNYAPGGLYPHGQNRASFLPAIAALESHVTVLHLEGQDHRMRALTSAGVFFVDPSSHPECLQRLWRRSGWELSAGTITVQHRPLPVLGCSRDAVWCDFDVLCRGNRSQADYLWLAQRFRWLFLSRVPQLRREDGAAARRLTWLIDVLYEHRTKLVLQSAVALDQLYLEGDFAHEFTRTVSRMTEMQSAEYLALAPVVRDAISS